MKVIAEYSVCSDCLTAIANDDFTGLDYHYVPGTAKKYQRVIQDGIEALGPGLCAGNEEYGFCKTPCDCCGSKLHGDRYQVIQLGEVKA